ncbi:MAG: hypothetical protein IJC31_07480 [Spirochaetaceae bacterium]|nr:hypothetical protein [Spirochaetaceae bacterium]
MLLYGLIASSGLRTIVESGVALATAGGNPFEPDSAQDGGRRGVGKARILLSI